jgi:predicted phage terminase large subunit-like protein
VGVAPAATSGEGASDTGIVVASLGRDGHAYVLADASCHLSPGGWGARVVGAYETWEADKIVPEANNGGEMVTFVLRTVNDTVPVDPVHASQGKRTRAEPVAALYEQHRVHHVGRFADLESQMTTWVPGESDSPDRVDALVWAVSSLLLNKRRARLRP